MKVLSFQIVLVPSAIEGQYGFNFYGLGDDNKMYQWHARDGKWILVKG